MATTVIMPRQGQSVESCVITTLSIKKSDKINIGDILFSYETDKSAFDEKAQCSGEVLEIYYEEGDVVKCLDAVCVIGVPGEIISVSKESVVSENNKPQASPSTANTAVHVNITEVKPDLESVIPSSEMKVSPRAKGLAERSNVDYTAAVPSGPDGRIIERDIDALLEKRFSREVPVVDNVNIPANDLANALSTPVSYEFNYKEEKLSNVRRLIAKTMTESLNNSAQLTLNSSFDASQILNYRKMIKSAGEPFSLENITINDMVLYACARVLTKHKALNAHISGDSIKFFDAVNLGVAVDTDRGLIVPALINAEKLTLNELSKQAKELIKEAKSGALSPDNVKCATFTVTNLGALGIESFTPVINPPQTGILGVNTITKRVKDSDTVYDCMTLSLTFDHRALDGAPAARFLSDLCYALENFSLFLSK